MIIRGNILCHLISDPPHSVDIINPRLPSNWVVGQLYGYIATHMAKDPKRVARWLANIYRHINAAYFKCKVDSHLTDLLPRWAAPKHVYAIFPPGLQSSVFSLHSFGLPSSVFSLWPPVCRLPSPWSMACLIKWFYLCYGRACVR